MSEKEKGLIFNEKIIFPLLQLIGTNGENLGIVSRDDALMQARMQGLDLVLLAERGGEGKPVVKIVDVGKMLYEKKKQQADARKKQHVVLIKEIKMRPKIGEHDFETKVNQGIQFLKEGKRLKLTLVFGRGREMLGKDERGRAFFEKIEAAFREAPLENFVHEGDLSAGFMWSRIYYLKK